MHTVLPCLAGWALTALLLILVDLYLVLQPCVIGVPLLMHDLLSITRAVSFACGVNQCAQLQTPGCLMGTVMFVPNCSVDLCCKLCNRWIACSAPVISGPDSSHTLVLGLMHCQNQCCHVPCVLCRPMMRSWRGPAGELSCSWGFVPLQNC